MDAQAAATGALSAAERSYPTSEVRGRSQEDPVPEGRRPRGATHVRGQGQWPRVPDCDGAGMAERSYPTSEDGGAAKRSYPASEVRGSEERSYPASEVRGGGQEEIPHALKPGARGGGWEEQPHAVVAWAQEGLEELSQVEGQEG